MLKWLKNSGKMEKGILNLAAQAMDAIIKLKSMKSNIKPKKMALKKAKSGAAYAKPIIR